MNAVRECDVIFELEPDVCARRAHTVSCCASRKDSGAWLVSLHDVAAR